jgi:cell division septum initiation protein DivIVA
VRALALAALAAAALTGCGSPADLTPDQAETLKSARERLDDAIDTEETCRTDRDECRHLVAEARRTATDPEQLAKVVPSLVTPSGNVYPPAFNAFQQDALADPKLALRLPAAKEAQRMVNVLSGKDAGTVIKPLHNQKADAYLAEAARDTQIWPDIARVLRQARDEL